MQRDEIDDGADLSAAPAPDLAVEHPPASDTDRIAALETLIARLAETIGRFEAAEAERRATLEQLGALRRTVEEHHRQIQIRAVMDWIAQAALRTNPLVSIVMPTRNRCHLLPRAIASVKAQTYPNWELLIVDDASTDGTPDFLASLDDKAIRLFRAHGAGATAARNVALAEMRGEFIAYADDDNTMHPQWLKSIVWGFEQRPDASVIYGAFVVDDAARISKKGRGDLPYVCFYPYDHHNVAIHNIADMGGIAHRAGLAEGRFDVTLREMGDWDLFLRLTRDAPPLGLPAIACFYHTESPDSLSHGPTHEADLAKVRAKNRR